MSQKQPRGDFYSGIPWVYVTGDQARGLPQGRLNLILWVIVVYFIAIAALKFGWVLSVGGGLGVALLNGIWPFLTGLGLAFRIPWAVIMASVSAGLTVWALLRGLGEGSVVILIEVIANVGILFYLIDGDRPNLIYRHRYRKYSVEDETLSE